ncbi:conserved hypothetical protein [Neospora caninum Liverpool]|uniref:Transmembrane protein 14C n=1 Tax=Neospora caninum (strain Liverpool) TaxID=572307 RepID=F0VLH0_NEOCL|nr:conserved hypothetical protein [Neospora caninum Liverpool]CBZ54098.1 conserved hypothetical protein [Neospora caninum Liverpool]CEL68797.1 TPA: hypothetical protein BN1204_045310 [Neospora caninum Liverpool]|eukprot:XP_003884129.1 conserved hypothetical protein [Neospora caninum Liverpool]
MGLHHLAASSAAVLMAGGVAAYMKANSLPSLVGSVGLASSFVASTYLFTQTDHIGGASLIATLGGAATAAMGYKRYLVAAKPAVPVTLMVVGALNTAYYGYQTLHFKENM